MNPHNTYHSNFGYILDKKVNFNELKFTNIYFNFLMQFSSTTLHFDLPFTNFNSISEVNNYIMDWVENDNKLRDKTILYNLISRFDEILKESKALYLLNGIGYLGSCNPLKNISILMHIPKKAATAILK